MMLKLCSRMELGYFITVEIERQLVDLKASFNPSVKTLSSAYGLLLRSTILFTSINQGVPMKSSSQTQLSYLNYILLDSNGVPS